MKGINDRAFQTSNNTTNNKIILKNEIQDQIFNNPVNVRVRSGDPSYPLPDLNTVDTFFKNPLTLANQYSMAPPISYTPQVSIIDNDRGAIYRDPRQPVQDILMDIREVLKAQHKMDETEFKKTVPVKEKAQPVPEPKTELPPQTPIITSFPKNKRRSFDSININEYQFPENNINPWTQSFDSMTKELTKGVIKEPGLFKMLKKSPGFGQATNIKDSRGEKRRASGVSISGLSESSIGSIGSMSSSSISSEDQYADF